MRRIDIRGLELAVAARCRVDLRGIVLLFAGAILSAASFSMLTWYSASGGPDSAGEGFTFSDLHDNANQLSAPVATAYFDRLAWGLVGLVVLIGLASKLHTPLATALRVLGFLTGIAGITLTFYALAQLFNAQRVVGGSRHSVLHSATYGFWVALAGYLISAVGAVIVTPVTDVIVTPVTDAIVTPASSTEPTRARTL